MVFAGARPAPLGQVGRSRLHAIEEELASLQLRTAQLELERAKLLARSLRPSQVGNLGEVQEAA
jgi:hypothetical protein